MNKVILAGRLSKDPDIRSAGDTTVAKFTLAVDRKFKKDEERKADFINCAAFGSQATFIEKYFKKGDAMTLDGHIQTGSYKNRDGQTVYTTDVIIDSVEFALGGKNNNNNSNTTSSKSSANDGFMNVPEGTEDELPFN